MNVHIVKCMGNDESKIIIMNDMKADRPLIPRKG